MDSFKNQEIKELIEKDMKRDSKFNAAIGINFALSLIFSIIIDFIATSSNRGSCYGEHNNINNEILKIQGASVKFHLIHSWPDVKAAKIYTDSGTSVNSYHIEDLVLNHGGAFLWAQKVYLKAPLLN